MKMEIFVSQKDPDRERNSITEGINECKINTLARQSKKKCE